MQISIYAKFCGLVSHLTSLNPCRSNEVKCLPARHCNVSCIFFDLVNGWVHKDFAVATTLFSKLLVQHLDNLFHIPYFYVLIPIQHS